MSRRLLFLVVATALMNVAFGQQPTSPDKKAEMIRLVDSLEVNPYGDDANQSRKAVMAWLTDAPDVTVTVCMDLLGDAWQLMDEKDDPGLLLQLMFAEARFILQHPEQAQDAQAVHTAGLQGALAFYDSMKKQRPELKIATLEEIAQTNADGKLAVFVRRAMMKCK